MEVPVRTIYRDMDTLVASCARGGERIHDH
jgi:predicted DNA-binding transcriptional regulator YafY